MPDARVQLAIEIETQGAEQLTALRRQLEDLRSTGTAAFGQLDASLRAVLDRLRQSRQLVGAATRDFLQSHRQMFSSLEPVFQGFFQRLLAGARNFRDAFKRLIADLLDFFLRAIARMLSAWLDALRRMLSGGGILGGFLGLFLGGLLGGTGSGFPTAFATTRLLSAGSGIVPLLPGAGALGLPLPPGGGGGASATNLGLLSRLGLSLRGLGPIPGGVVASGGLLALLLGLQRGSPILGVLGGAATGFAFGGPIGAVIGGIVGLIGGLFRRGKIRRQAAQAEEAFQRQIIEIREAFKRFQIDFQTAISTIQDLWAQFQAVMPERFGKFGRRAVRSQAPIVRTVLNQIKHIQEAREMRAAIIESLPIPEFQLGSILRAVNARDGRILAFLHQGEAVLNRRAVQALGERTIEQLNRSPSPLAGAAGKIHITINIDGRGQDPERIADFTIRKLQRELRDRGIVLG